MKNCCWAENSFIYRWYCKKSLEKLKDIILLYFRALPLDLLRFSYLLEDHQESELHPLHLTWMQTGFFWTLFVPYMKEKYVMVAVCRHPLRFFFRCSEMVSHPCQSVFPCISVALSGRESTYPCVPSHSLLSHTSSPLWASTEDGWCPYFLILCAVWMERTSWKQSLSPRPKISKNTLSGRYPCEVLTWDCTRMGLMSCQQTTQHLAKPPQTWQLVLGLETTQMYLNAT